MVKYMKKFRLALMFGSFAISSILLNASSIEYGNIFLSTNPILTFLFFNAEEIIVNETLQMKEANSAIIHYNEVAYFVHFISYVLTGFLLDWVKNKRLFST